MLIFTISLDPEAEPGHISFPDPAALKQIISDPGGSGSITLPMTNPNGAVQYTCNALS
jgi:hypothetical protein